MQSGRLMKWQRQKRVLLTRLPSDVVNAIEKTTPQPKIGVIYKESWNSISIANGMGKLHFTRKQRLSNHF